MSALMGSNPTANKGEMKFLRFTHQGNLIV